LAPDPSGKIKGHTASGRKTEEERGRDVLENFRNDLRRANFAARFLHATSSFDEARTVLVEKIKVTPQAADNIIDYLKRNDIEDE